MEATDNATPPVLADFDTSRNEAVAHRAVNFVRTGRGLALAAAAIGLLALVGWAAGIEFLKSTIPGEVTMKPNTALAIVLLSFATISLGRGRHPMLGYAAATAGLAIGAVTLLEYATGWNPGVDTLLFAEQGDEFRTSSPGRMAPNSAAAFVLCGTGLLLWGKQTRRGSPTNMILLLTAGIGLLALIGYSSDVQSLFGISASVTSMAVPTATAILLISVAGLLHRSDRGIVRAIAADGAEGEALRMLLPAVLLGPLAAGLMVSRLEAAGVFGRGLGLWLLNVILIAAFTSLAAVLSRRLGALDRERLLQARSAERSAALAADAETRTRAILETAQESFVSIDSEGVIAEWNGAAEDTFGWAAGDAIGRKLVETIVPGDQREAHQQLFDDFLRTREHHLLGRRLELETVGRDGLRFPVEATITAHEMNGELRLNTFLHEISERRRQEQELQQRSTDLAAIAEATGELARTTDPQAARTVICEVARRITDAPIAALLEPSADGRGLRVSARVGVADAPEETAFTDGSGAAEAFVGMSRVFAEQVGPGAAVNRAPGLGAEVRSALWQPVLQGSLAVGVLAIGWEEPVASPPESTKAALEMLAAEASVAIERAALLTRLDAAARTDELTGLPNRRSWDEQIAQEVARATREPRPLCVAMLDIDRFKDYNDRHGHQAGDRVLRATAAAWRSELRATDILARYGGEEFSLLLPGCPRAEGVRLLERLRACMPEGVTCSAGIAEWDRIESIDGAVGRADEALYEAKRQGRDRAIASPTPV